LAKLDQLTRNAVHVIVFGPPKAGKTVLVGELATHGFRLWFFDLENGNLALQGNVPKEFHSNIEVFKIPDTKDFPMAIETCLKVIKPGRHEICDLHGKVSCPLCGKYVNVSEKKKAGTFSIFDNTVLTDKDIVVFDSLTQLSNSAMNHIGAMKDDLWKPEWDHFRSQGQLLERFLSTIQNAPWNAVVITHEMSIELDESSGSKEKIIPVGGTKNFARTVPKYFDEVVYMEMKNKNHHAASSTRYSLNVLTGSRSNTSVEEASKGLGKISLLPIFANLKIGGAETILESIKQKLEAEKVAAK
jgi:hypothetical protein